MKIQAGRARTYQEHSTRLAELRLTYSLQEYHTLSRQLKQLEAKREDAQFRLDDVAGDLQRKQNELAAKREQLDAHRDRRRQRHEYELVQASAQMRSRRSSGSSLPSSNLQQIGRADRGVRARPRRADRSCDETSACARDRKRRARSGSPTSSKPSASEIDQRQQAFRDGQLQLNALEPADRAAQVGDPRPDAASWRT